MTTADDVFELIAQGKLDKFKSYSQDNEDVIPILTNKAMQTALHVAVEHGQQEFVTLLLGLSTINARAKDNKGQTPLHYLCKGPHVTDQLALALLSDGVSDVHARDNDGNTALLLACANPTAHVMLEILVDKGSSVNVINSKGESPLIRLCRFPTDVSRWIRLMCEHKANVNAIEEKGIRPLYEACGLNAMENIKVLLEYNANVNAICTEARTPFVNACVTGRNIQVVKYLLEQGKVKVNMDYAIDHITILHELCSDKEETPLDLCALLVEHDANVNTLDWMKRTPLHMACSTNNKNVMETVTFLVETAGANIDLVDFNKNTAIFLASWKNPPLMLYLLDKGASYTWTPVYKNSKDTLPLYYAGLRSLIRQGGNMASLRALLEDIKQQLPKEQQYHYVNLQDTKGESALFYAVDIERVDIVELLVEAGADVDMRAKNGFTPLEMAVHNKRQYMVDWLNNNNNSTLH
jgi:ankyrin repeat protein